MSVKTIVESYYTGAVTTKATFVKVESSSSLTILIEDQDYIIPVRLVKKDLGAEKRFRSLNLQEGDTLVVSGVTGMIKVFSGHEEYKGIDKAVIQSVKPRENAEEETVAEPILNARSAFPGMSANPTPSENGNRNVPAKNEENCQSVHLIGRRVDGNLIAPNIRVQEEGTIVVRIWVDVYGNVQKAIPGIDGTTINNVALWNEAKKAAMKTHFTKDQNLTADTPELQEGTITYLFKLR